MTLTAGYRRARPRLYRLALPLYGLLLAACTTATTSYQGNAVASCRGLINIGCTATVRQTTLPSVSDWLVLAFSMLVVACGWAVIFSLLRALGRRHPAP